MLAADVDMAADDASDVTGAGDADQTRKPTRDNLITNFVEFLRNLDPEVVLPHLYQKEVLDLDDYKLFREMKSITKRSEIVNKLLCTILQKEAAQPSVMKRLHETLVNEKYKDLADLLCSAIPSSPSADSRQSKKPRQWEMVKLGDLTEGQERLGIAVCMKILHNGYFENTAAEFIVGEGDHARHLHVLLQTYQLDQELLSTGSSVLLCDGAWVGGHLVASSRCLSRTGVVTVSEAGLSQAESLMSSLHSEEAASIGTPLKTIMEASVELLHSTIVEIFSVELRKQIMCCGDMTCRKDFRIRDDTGEMSAELWGHLASTEISHGQKWRFFGKVTENKQKKKVFRIIKADCVDRTTVEPDSSWLSSDGHVEGHLHSFEIFLYDTCSKPGCSSKRLGPDKSCKKCGTSFIDASPTRCAYADLRIVHGGALMELRAFTPEISQLYTALGLELDLCLPKHQLEQLVLKAIPLQCGVRFEGSIVLNMRSRHVQLNDESAKV